MISEICGFDPYIAVASVEMLNSANDTSSSEVGEAIVCGKVVGRKVWVELEDKKREFKRKSCVMRQMF